MWGVVRIGAYKETRRLLLAALVFSTWTILTVMGVLVGLMGETEAASLPLGDQIGQYTVLTIVTYPIINGLLLIYVWLSRFENPDQIRTLVMKYLGVSTVLVGLPWVYFLILTEPVLVGATNVGTTLVLAGSLAAAFLLGFGRRTLVGSRFIWVLLTPVVGGLFLFLWVRPFSAEVLGALPGLTGGFLFAGLVLQYPSMLWYAWKTPVEEWGADTSGEGGAPPETTVQFESPEEA